ncbi:MAG: hypothetical protein PVG70_17735 [Desulfobacterales bacterium]|jgi:hypothetical protein
MKTRLDLKQHGDLNRYRHYLIIMMMLLFLTAEGNFINQVRGQELTEEPNISIEIQDQPLGEVLDIISQDTGYTFNVSRQWKDYSVNASIQSMPLNKGLNRILAGLNHVIIYESEKIVNILVYGKANPGERESYSKQSRSSLIKKFQLELVNSPQSLSEKTFELEDADEDSDETDTAEDDELVQDSSSQDENSNAQDEMQ